jgi:autotransporter-associated beta strand protein
VSTLTNNGTLIFNRSDASTYSGIISGTGAVTKKGGGVLTFTGTSGYTGSTHVYGGSLLVNGQLGNTAVSVASGGLLGGSGTINGALTVLAGGTLSPGNSPGILHVGSLQLDSSSTTLMEITGTAAGLYDQIVATSNIAYGGLLQFTISGSYAKDTTFELFQFTSVSGSFSSLTMAGSGPYAGLTFGAIGTGGYGADAWVSDWTTPTAPNGQRLVFFQNNGTLVVIPEPSTYAMALAGLACGGWQMMRRRRLRPAPTLAA